MYKDEILDLYKRPRNEGIIKNPDLEGEGENSSCGDHLHISLNIEEGKIEEVKHKTDGCAISTAAASILTEEIQGKSLEKAKNLKKSWMLDKLGIDVSPMRVKCAMLALNTLKGACKEKS